MSSVFSKDKKRVEDQDRELEAIKEILEKQFECIQQLTERSPDNSSESVDDFLTNTNVLPANNDEMFAKLEGALLNGATYNKLVSIFVNSIPKIIRKALLV